MSKGGHGGKGGHHPSPNDQRSNSMNPNNSAYHASQGNRTNQLNPNNPEYKQTTNEADDEEED